MRVYTSVLVILGVYLLPLLHGCGSKTNGSSGNSDNTGATSTVATDTGGTTAPSFVVEMPVRSEDAANVFLGIWPFGVHGGHGVIQSVTTESFNPSKKTIQIQHNVGGRNYRTNYTNIENQSKEAAV